LRLVVALCGVLAGAAALGFGWWGQQSLLFETKTFTPTMYVLVVLVVHAIALASIGGGMAVLVAPRVGRVAMLSSAVGWLLLIAFLGGGIKPVVALLTVLSAAGGLGAFLSSVQTPLFRLERVDAPTWQPSRRSRRPTPPARRERPQPAPAPLPPAVFDDHSRPFEPLPLEEEDHSRPFVEPPPEPSPAIGAVTREDFFGSRRKEPPPSPQRPRRRRGGTNWAAVGGVAVLALAIGGTAIVVVYDSLTSEGGAVLPATVSVAEAPSVEVQAPVLSSAASPSSSAETAALSKVSALPAASEEDRLPAGSPDLAIMPQEASASLPSEIDLADDPDPASSSSSSTADSSSVAAVSSLLPQVDASMAALPPITPPSSFKSPYEYCASVANTDSPDAKKITGGIAELTQTARDQAALFNGEVRWRCMEGAVWVCVQPAGALSCDKVPSATDRVLICAAHPDTPGIRNAGGDWSCNGFTPVVSAAQLNAADHRGFDKSSWKKQTPPAPVAVPAPNQG
jgi:hypothetical protein